MHTGLYFIAIVPDDPVQQEVTAFKQYAAQQFDSRHALRAPAHITLKAPFRCPPEELPALKMLLKDFALQREPFEVGLQGFNHFSERVIFVEISENRILQQLYHDLTELLTLQAQLPPDHRFPDFHPHMTVAFKDLQRAAFPAAWAWFEKQLYSRVFLARSISLLQHQHQRWQLNENFPFKT